jgi:hypothetical protein
MKTICQCCEKVLTDEKRRYYSATFDSGLSAFVGKRKHTNEITYAFCDECYEEKSEELRKNNSKKA